LGSDEADLIAYLTSIGFKILESCEHDPTIHRALFKQSIPGPTFVWYEDAKVQWQVDSENRIVWVKGFVTYLPP